MFRRRRSSPETVDTSTPPSREAIQTPATFPALEGLKHLSAAVTALDIVGVDDVLRSFAWSGQDWLVSKCAASTATRQPLLELGRRFPEHPQLAAGSAWAHFSDATSGIDAALGNNIATQASWARYYDGLQTAETVAEAAVRLDPNSPLPWRVLTHTARKVEPSIHELNYRIGEYRRRNPNGLAGCLDYALAIEASKGPGESTLPTEIEQLVADEPDGSPIWSVIACVLAAHQLPDDGDPDLHMNQVRAEFDRIRLRSIDHPGFPAGADEIDALEALNHFAFASVVINDDDVTTDLLRRLGGRYTASPWSTSGETTDVMIERRRAQTG